MTKLTTAEVDTIIAETVKRGEALGKALSVAVVDAGGYILQVKRTDGARALTPAIAISKAHSSAVMERPTRNLHAWAESNPGFFDKLSQMSLYPIVATEGGVTIKRDGEVLGGLGISGGTPDEDEATCNEVLESLGYELVFRAWGQSAQQLAESGEAK
ncbi:GlcG/HbpS family heme-binding protein [Nocardia sp. alder85J]|uniref:GlcG/HbpS family heme-binding protein n=1 Tax=Nocardia sp. alder85J TaxID=2862949 RepID=UPI001CD6493D|nr:heme-binding protein [Nocardia sp. alder85J]MCX4090793.1 heme-binding protein [Nocardia sp. alder85J]